MRRVMYYSLAGRDVHISKLIGAFIIVVALLLFFKSGANMIDSWDNVKFVNACLKNVAGDEEKFIVCQDQALKSLDVYIRPGQDELNTKQFAMALLSPIAWLLFWIVVLILGLFFYRTGAFQIPIEERAAEKPVRPVRKPKKVKKKKK